MLFDILSTSHGSRLKLDLIKFKLIGNGLLFKRIRARNKLSSFHLDFGCLLQGLMLSGFCAKIFQDANALLTLIHIGVSHLGEHECVAPIYQCSLLR